MSAKSYKTRDHSTLSMLQ